MNKHHKASFSYYFIFGRTYVCFGDFLINWTLCDTYQKCMHLINLHFRAYLVTDKFYRNIFTEDIHSTKYFCSWAIDSPVNRTAGAKEVFQWKNTRHTDAKLKRIFSIMAVPRVGAHFSGASIQ